MEKVRLEGKLITLCPNTSGDSSSLTAVETSYQYDNIIVTKKSYNEYNFSIYLSTEHLLCAITKTNLSNYINAHL
jgi:hypothetical protein